MENPDVRRRVREAITAARRRAAERRAKVDEAATAWAAVLPRVVVPTARQMAQALAAEQIRLQVSTPEDRVLIASEHRPEDHLEVSLEAANDDAVVLIRAVRGREAVTEERVLVRGAAAIGSLGEERVLEELLAALAPWMAR